MPAEDDAYDMFFGLSSCISCKISVSLHPEMRKVLTLGSTKEKVIFLLYFARLIVSL